MAASVVFKLHGALMRLIADVGHEEFIGLRSAASSLRRRRVIDNRLAKQLVRVDDAAALLRHATSLRSTRMLAELRAQLEGVPSVDVGRTGQDCGESSSASAELHKYEGLGSVHFFGESESATQTPLSNPASF